MAKPSTLADAITQAMEALGSSEEREAEWQAQLAKDEAFERALKRTAALEPVRSQLPDATHRALVHGEALADTMALRAMVRWVTKPDAPRVVVLSGPTGCGKTVAMAYALAELGGLWAGCSELARASLASFGPEREMVERAIKARNLCVDDVGAESSERERVKSLLVELLEKRQGSTRTVLTTNLNRAAFAAAYADERLSSRLARVAWIECKGEDMRRAK